MRIYVRSMLAWHIAVIDNAMSAPHWTLGINRYSCDVMALEDPMRKITELPGSASRIYDSTLSIERGREATDVISVEQKVDVL